MANEDTTEATIGMLERGVDEALAKIRALRMAINTICAQEGLPPRYAEDELAASAGGRLVQIKDDTFYGKKQTPAMREYLEMRKAQNMGPAKPREIYDALKSGGFQFGSKEEETALVGLRELLRTQPQIFHRLPQGAWGLTLWYPDVKRDDAKPKKGWKKKRAKPQPSKAPRAAKPEVVSKPAEPQKPWPTTAAAAAPTNAPSKNQKAA